MSLLLTCSCGKQLRVPDDYTGRRVKCPACGEPQTVPDASQRTPPPKTHAPDMIRFACECGKQMQAKADFAGRTTRCPACEAQVLIPGGDDEESRSRARFRADRPEPRAARTFDDRDDRSDRDRDRDDRYDDEDDRPRKRKGRKRKVWPWVVGGVGVLLLLVGGGIGAWLLFSGGIADDLALVPGDAQGFVTVRPADLWKLDWTQQFLSELKKQNPAVGDIAALCQEKVGLAPDEVERATFVATDIQNEKAWGIIYTVKPYDKSKIIAKIPGAREASHAGKSYHVANLGRQALALHFVNDRTFLVGPEVAIKDALGKMTGKHKKGPLDDALKLASKKHHLVAAMVPPPELVKARGQIPGDFSKFGTLLDFETAHAVLDVTKANKVEMELALNFSGSSKAKEAKTLVDGFVSIIKMFATAGKANYLNLLPPGPERDKASKDFDEALETLKADRSGSTVSLTMKSPMGSPAQTVAALRGGLPIFPGANRGPVRPGFPPGGPGFPPNPGPGPPKRDPFGPGFPPNPVPGGGAGLDPATKIRMAAQRTQSSNNLKHLVLAMHMYHDMNRQLPTAATYGPVRPGSRLKRSLLSWRVQLLPYLGDREKELYNQFHHDEPWSSPHNRTLITRMPKVFALPGKDADAARGKTYYKVFTGANTPFNKEVAARIPASFPDGTSNTILIVEAASPSTWTQPIDIPYLNTPFAKGQMGNHWGNDTTQVVLADGSVRAVSRKISDETLDHAIRPNDGMPLGKDW